MANTPIDAPINLKYRLNSLKWVYTCPYFVTSRFLICKLIQIVDPVSPTYLEVRRNRMIPFLLHSVLQPEGPCYPTESPSSAGDFEGADENGMNPNASDEELDDDDGLIYMESGLAIGDRVAFRERFTEHIETIRHFCDGLEYQLPIEDHLILETVERERSFIFAAGSEPLKP